MKIGRFSINRFRTPGLAAFILAFASYAFGQSDVSRQTIAVTYPLDETVTVKFRGTTLLPRLKGEAKVRRAGRRGTRVELSVENLPRATELGGPYTTYVLWAISPEGRMENLGEIKRSGSFIVDSKLDVTTPLQSFALVLTAEPHFLVRSPSKMVVLENLPPQRPGNSEVATVSVNYLGNSGDYFKDSRIPGIPDADYKKTPVSLLGARQAINLAKYAGAERDAEEELNAAVAQLEEAENAWRLRQDEAEVGRPAQPLGVLGERLLDRLLVAPQGPVAVADSEELPPLSARQALLPVRDVADLLGHLVRVPVVVRLDEEHSRPPFDPGLLQGQMQVPFRLAEGLLPLVAGDRAQLGEQLVFGDLQASALGRPMGEKTHRPEGRWP